MSGTEFYLSKGWTPATRTVNVSGTDTFTVWTPESTKRVIITELTVSTNAAGTIVFYFDHPSEVRIAEFMLGASSTISPMIGAWESTVVGGKIRARTGVGLTDGWRINAVGFELG